MGKSIIQLVDELPADNITVKVLKALDYVAPGEWNNLVGFDNTIKAVTGETDPKVIQRLRDRAVSLYFDPKKGYEAAVTVYQTIDKADAAMGAAAMANKIGEKISFLSFLNNITPKADVTQTIDLLLKIAVEIIAYCKLNGIPQPNPQQFAAALANNYQDAALMRMVALVCIDGLLPLGPDFLSKIQTIISGTDPNTVAQNPVFSAVSSSLPGNSTSDKFGFITQAFSSVQGWMNGLVSKTGLTPQSVFNSIGQFIQVADDSLDFVAAFLDQTTNYYEHTGIQTVARRVILDAYDAVKVEMQQEGATSSPSSSASAPASAAAATATYAVGQTVEVWDGEDEDWYQATIQKIKTKEYYVHYVGYGSSDDEWVDEDDVRSRDFAATDDNGYAVGQKVKVWDDDEEEWYSAIIKEIRRNQYYIHYIGYDDSDDEWVNKDDIS